MNHETPEDPSEKPSEQFASNVIAFPERGSKEASLVSEQVPNTGQDAEVIHPSKFTLNTPRDEQLAERATPDIQSDMDGITHELVELGKKREEAERTLREIEGEISQKMAARTTLQAELYKRQQ